MSQPDFELCVYTFLFIDCINLFLNVVKMNQFSESKRVNLSR